MSGTVSDMVARLAKVLPTGWFPDGDPVLDILLNGMAGGLSGAYGQLQFVQGQTRLGTATAPFLDQSAQDYQGGGFVRRNGETDAQFLARLQPVFRDAGTRAALTARLISLTGNAPTIFEPMRATDTGGYGIAQGYGVGGGYGSVSIPFQFFVKINRPLGLGIPYLSGYGIPAGGYGVGAQAYGSQASSLPHVTDADIYAEITNTLPAGTTAWVALGGATPPTYVPPGPSPGALAAAITAPALGQLPLGSRALG